jgi:hypothetical protein
MSGLREGKMGAFAWYEYTHPNLVHAIVVLAVAAAIGIFVDRRKYHRRNAMGAEQFSNYGQAMAFQGVEAILVGVAVMLGLIGLGIIALTFVPPDQLPH